LPWLLLRYRPHVVYNRGLFHSFLAQAICRLLGTPFVVEINGIGDEELAMRRRPVQAALVRLFDRWNLRWASAFVCVTRKLGQELVRRGTRPERITVIHNGAATDLFVPGDPVAARIRLGLPADVALVGFVGTLTAWQGIDLLINAAAVTTEPSNLWQVVIVGTGESHDDLARQITEKNLQNRVRLLPGVPHDQAALFLQAIDMVAIPIYDQRKLRYGFSSLKFWEALSAGLPALVPDQCDLGDVLAERNWPGEYRTADAADLAAQIAATAARLPELRGRRAEIHDWTVRQHSWAAVARQTEELFLRLTAKKKSQEAP
jgi:glycosyltransferase involved in cell wall biosynthesis